MQPRFIFQRDGIRDDGLFANMTADERLQFAMRGGLPSEEITAPIDAWCHSRVAEFGAPLAGLLVEKEGV